MTKKKPPFSNVSQEERVSLVRAIAARCPADILDANACRAILFSLNGVNGLTLEQAGAARAAKIVQASVVQRLLLLVERAFDNVDWPGDRHMGVAIYLLRDRQTFETVGSEGDREQLEYAMRLWDQLKTQDPRRERLRHFRDKFVAHRAEPNPGKGSVLLDELTAYAMTTSLMWSRLALGVGTPLPNIDEHAAADIESARAFWRPWSQFPHSEDGRRP